MTNHAGAAMAEFEVLERLAADQRVLFREKAKALTREQIRYLVDVYYQVQEFRKALGNQEFAAQEQSEPASMIGRLFQVFERTEREIKLTLDWWTDDEPTSAWAKSIYGIGPVISAGLAAYIDIERAPTAGHIWSFAGLDPSKKWEKKQKRPWNARLKVLCWKIGDSFVKFSGRDECFYGKLYLQRKEYEVNRNLKGGNAECAKKTLEEKDFRRDTAARKAYLEGRLPDGRIDLRARRWAVKIFLSHYQEVAWWNRFKERVPKPYAFVKLGHGHYIEVPGFGFE